MTDTERIAALSEAFIVIGKTVLLVDEFRGSIWVKIESPCDQYNRHCRPGTWLCRMTDEESPVDVVSRYMRWEKATLAH